MIRVTHLITGLGTGGAETALSRLVARMDPARFENRVVGLCGQADTPVAQAIRHAGVAVETLGMRRGAPNPLSLLRLVRLLGRHRPHVVQTWLYHADLMGLLAARAPGIGVLGSGGRLCWNIRCAEMELAAYNPLTRWVRAALARFSPLPDAVVSNSRAAREYHAELGYRPRRWEVIPNGFDTERFRPDPEARAAVRAEWGLGDGPLVGMVARWDHMKGHDTFCAMAGRVLAARPEVRFVLVGDGMAVDNEALMDHVRRRGVQDALVLAGRRADVERVMTALDVCVLASHGESFPNVVGEAMACATPVAATDVGDAADILGDAGRVVPPRAPAALAAAVLGLLALPGEERRVLGRAARERVVSHYGLEAVVARYEALYAELAGEGA